MAIGLLNFADDEGYFLADPILIRNHLRPFDDQSTSTRDMIVELEKAEYIEVCERSKVGPIGRVVNFQKHQRIDRPNLSKLKGYFDSTIIRRSFDDHSTTEGIRDQGSGNGTGNGLSLSSKAVDTKICGEDWVSRISEIHGWYCEQTGFTDHPLRWEAAWLEWFKAGNQADDFKRVLKYLREQIQRQKRNDGCLKLSNLLQPDTFSQDLMLAKQPPTHKESWKNDPNHVPW